jgi:hypothetical protein
MPPVTPADSAAPAPAAQPLESQQDFAESDFQAYKESENRATLDRASGKAPAKKEAKETPKPADSAAADTATEDQPTPGDSATPPADTAADSAAAQVQKKGKTPEDSERRWKQLSEEKGALQRRVEELERRLASPPAKDQATEPDSQPAAKAEAKTEPKIDDVDEKTGQPKYRTLAEYMSARETWLEDKLLSRVQADQKKAEQARAQTEQQQIINQGWNAKVEPARKKYADFDAVALNPDLPIKAGSVPDAFVLDSEYGADVLYYLGQHPDLLDAINEMNPLRQARELFSIEQKFVKPASAAKTASRAPAPPHEVSGQGTVPPDETEQALEDDDFEAYKAAENRKAIARAKGK